MDLLERRRQSRDKLTKVDRLVMGIELALLCAIGLGMTEIMAGQEWNIGTLNEPETQLKLVASLLALLATHA